jgi:hypothetical protein
MRRNAVVSGPLLPPASAVWKFRNGTITSTTRSGKRHRFSVREIFSAIAAETGREVPHVVKPRRPGDPTYPVADPSAARNLTESHRAPVVLGTFALSVPHLRWLLGQHPCVRLALPERDRLAWFEDRKECGPAI